MSNPEEAVRTCSTKSRPALRAAAYGGRPRPVNPWQQRFCLHRVVDKPILLLHDTGNNVHPFSAQEGLPFMDGHLMQAARRWTPSVLVVSLFIAAIVAVFLVGTLAPQPRGHWTDHLTNATIDASMLVIVLVGTALTWRRLGQRPVIFLAAAALAIVLIGLLVEVVGNMRVAHVIWQTPYGDDSVDAYASGLPGYDSGHTLAGNGDLLVLVGGIAFATVLGVSRRVGTGVALGGAALSIIPPPFIIPAFGVTFLLAWLLRPMSHHGNRVCGLPINEAKVRRRSFVPKGAT
jgi:hypothetical protein